MVKLRLFPFLIVLACLSLGVRLVDIFAGSTALTPSVQAQEADAPKEDDTPPTEAQAEEAQPSVDERQADPFAGAVIGLPSTEELALYGQLKQRREELDRREQQIQLQERLLAGTETRIDEKIAALRTLEVQIKGHLRIFEEQEAQQLESIVTVYQAMNAKDAAPRFQALELPVQVDLAVRMSSRKFAALLAEMDQVKATALTVELATRSEPPAIEDLAEQ